MENLFLESGAVSIVDSKKTAKKKYKCPYCEARIERAKLHIHIQDEHEDLIPEGYTALRVAFNAINHKTEGHCIICKKVTAWNEDKARYERLCDSPACHEAYKRMVAERTKKVYGTERLQTDPEYADYVQRKALEGRKMSGKYTFSDGGVVSFMGTYEKKFLEFMDKVMHAKSEDILAPGPSIKYQFEGQTHLYISDFFYVPYNLIVEIKDGGRNRNTHPKRLGEEEERIRAKEKAVTDLNMFNYVRVTDNDFGQLMTVMALLKYQLIHPTYNDYIIRVNESVVSEDMSGTIGAALPPASSKPPIVPIPSPMPYESDKDNYYVVQHPKNDDLGYSITKDPLQYSMVSVDPLENGFYKVYKTDKGKINKKSLTFKIKDRKAGEELYNELCKIAESSGQIFNSKIKSNYIYETLTEGNEILTPDQLFYDSRFELVNDPATVLDKQMGVLYSWLKGSELDKLEEQVNALDSTDSEREIGYHVLPDGDLTLDQLKQWEFEFRMLQPGGKAASDDISMRKYGQDNMTRYREKYSALLQNSDPEKVEVHNEASTMLPRISDILDYDDKLDQVRRIECDSSILIMVLTDRPYWFDEYTSEDINDLKEKWNRYNALDQEYRELSSQTASNIFGLDNNGLFDKAINTYLAKVQERDMEYSDHPVDECVVPYFIPSFKVMNSNPNGIFKENGCIDPYKYVKTLQELQHDLKCSKTEADRAMIKEQIIDYGWNPEIPCTESALTKTYMRFEPKAIQEIDAKAFLESQDATKDVSGLTSEQLKDKIVPIFVILFHGNRLHSKGIRWFTDSEWSHAGLSLDSSLDEIYTFTTNIKNAPNKHHRTGFAIDTKERYLKEDPHMKIKVYALFITPEQKAEIASAIKWYIDHQDETSYGFKNISNIFARKATKRRNSSDDKCKMVCSQFVYSLLTLVNFKMRKNKDGSTVSPADIDELSNDARFYAVYENGLDKYDPLKVDDLCYKLLPTLPIEIYGINESATKAFGRVKSAIGESDKISRLFEMADEMLNEF